MNSLGIDIAVADVATRDRAARRLAGAGVVLPRLADLADPLARRADPSAGRADNGVTAPTSADPDLACPENLFRVHWHNDRSRRGVVSVPVHVLIPPAVSGARAPIAIVLGCFFPMIGAHKVLAAYGCLIPRLVTGRFDPQRHKAVWPSTGNYCRGGVAISRILGCRAVAVLPGGMSAERFDWLRRWVAGPEDVVRTPGSESNVREIYDKCAELARNPDNVVLNQFAEFGNYLAHWACTGPALGRVFEALRAARPELRLAAFVAASGSAGTLAAGDYLKAQYRARIAAVEASECPTLLRNGYGEHNIQGIGDKHVPLVHNVMNTDVVIGVSDRSTAALDLLFNSAVGQHYLTRRKRIDPALAADLQLLGLSGIANLVAAIKLARRLDLGEDDLILTVATDSAALYASERRKFCAAGFPDGLDEVHAGEIFGQHLLGIADDDLLELTHDRRSRIFNLGYYTWVEQQGLTLEAFEQRRSQRFWTELQQTLPALDALIDEFNALAAAGPAR
jgi:cysteine synthase